MPGANEQIDFYILHSAGDAAVRHFACRLIEKIYKQGNRVFVLLDTLPDVQSFEQLLWTFSQGSFVPHAVEGAPGMDEAPVVIGQRPTDARAHVLVNLGQTAPEEAHRFPRVAEVIAQDDESKAAGRERFRQYRERGFALKTHEISP